MNKLLSALILCTACFSTEIYSQVDSTMVADSMPAMDPIRADRPDQTESSFLVPTGYFQVEMGFSITDTDPGFIYAYPAGLWKYGLPDNFELRLITNYITIQKEPTPDVRGFMPFAAGFKARL